MSWIYLPLGSDYLVTIPKQLALLLHATRNEKYFIELEYPNVEIVKSSAMHYTS